NFRWKIRALEYADKTGVSQKVDPTSPDYLNDYAFVASPAAGDRVVFAAQVRRDATGRPISNQGSAAYVFEPDAVIRFRLQPLNPAQPTLWTPAKAKEVM